MIVERIIDIVIRLVKGTSLTTKKGLCRKHKRILDQLRSSLSRRYNEGASKNLGDPLYKKNPEDEIKFKEYFQSGHFHKNFHTNYHALWNIFCRKGAAIPDVFYVYDLACGPYTATMGLLNFLNNGKEDFAKKYFVLTFCDMGDIYLEKLYQVNNNGHQQLSFPVELDLFPVTLAKGQITDTFLPQGYKIILNQCRQDNEHQCDLSVYPHIDKFDIPQGTNVHGINLIFCSYPGKYGERKFAHCIQRTINNFSPQQRHFPTYIIYSHFLKRFHNGTYDQTFPG